MLFSRFQASGNIGKHFAQELLKTGKHTVTALVRPDSKGVLPEGVKSVQVNFEDNEALINALNGQEFLVITLGVRAPPDLHNRVVIAAKEAGVSYLMPNIYGSDYEATITTQQPDEATDMVSAMVKTRMAEISTLR